MTKEEPGLESELLLYARERKGWSQRELAEANGISEGMISHLELGRRPFKGVTVASLAASMGYSDSDVMSFRRTVEKRRLHRKESELSDLDRSSASPARRAAIDLGLRVVRWFEACLDGLFSNAAIRRERREAERTFQVLAGLSRAEQKTLVETHPAYQTIGMVEQLCLASERAAGKDHRSAATLARFALRAAELLRAPASVGSRAQGYAWIFVGNALRVEGKLLRSDQAFLRASHLWEAGREAEGVFLEVWRLPDGKAVLRRDQRRWSEALTLHDQALSIAPQSARGRILVSKATVLEQMGMPEQAVKALFEAAPFIEARQEPNELLALRFNFAVNLTHLGRLEEAERELSEARKLAVRLGKDLHLQRCLWVSGRIAAKRGNLVEAVADFQQARRDFTARKLSLEAASVAMDEAIVLLRAGEHAKVALLAEEIAWIFAAEGVGKEALKALRLFYDAAQQHRATIELARQVQDRLRTTA